LKASKFDFKFSFPSVFLTLSIEGVKEKHSAKASLPSVGKKPSARNFSNLRNSDIVFA